MKSEESIAESGRMFIRNLSYTTTEDDIRKLFEKYGNSFSCPQCDAYDINIIFYLGPLTEVNLPIDRITRKLKGFGTITFLMTEHAVKAYSELDGSILDGRMLHLLPAKMKIDSLEDKSKKIYHESIIFL